MLLPISVIIDIARLAFNHETYGFLIFIEIIIFLAKFAGLFFGYKVCKSWESGEGAPYEGVGGAPPTMAPDFNNGSGSSEPAPGSMAPSMGGGNPYQTA